MSFPFCMYVGYFMCPSNLNSNTAISSLPLISWFMNYLWSDHYVTGGERRQHVCHEKPKSITVCGWMLHFSQPHTNGTQRFCSLWNSCLYLCIGLTLIWCEMRHCAALGPGTAVRGGWGVRTGAIVLDIDKFVKSLLWKQLFPLENILPSENISTQYTWQISKARKGKNSCMGGRRLGCENTLFIQPRFSLKYIYLPIDS